MLGAIAVSTCINLILQDFAGLRRPDAAAFFQADRPLVECCRVAELVPYQRAILSLAFASGMVAPQSSVSEEEVRALLAEAMLYLTLLHMAAGFKAEGEVELPLGVSLLIREERVIACNPIGGGVLPFPSWSEQLRTVTDGYGWRPALLDTLQTVE